MNTLLSLLRTANAVPAPLLMAAQHRQSRFSGSLGTNLLELQAIHARTLEHYLSTHRALPAVTLVGLMTQDRPVANLPSALIRDPMLAPLAVSMGELWVVVHPDFPDKTLRELQGRFPDLKFAITAECCFAQVWAQAYDTEISARYASLADDYLDQLQSSPPGEQRPAPVARLAKTPRAPAQRSAKAPTLPVALAVDPPDDWKAIETELRRAEDRDVVTHLLQRAAAQLSDRVALFRIKPGELLGMPSPGSRIDVDGIDVALSPSLAHALVHPRSIRRCVDLDLRLSVGLEQAVPCICAPVGLRGRPVLLLYLDRNGESFTAEEIAAVHHLCSLAAGQLLAHLRRHSREPDFVPAQATATFPEKGDTYPELPVLTEAEKHPGFWASKGQEPFSSWSAERKAIWESALATEDQDYFAQSSNASVEELATRLPGPQDNGESFDLHRSSAQASALGPVPRVLVALGDRAVDPVLRQLPKEDPKIRFAAALLFQELRSDRALDALAALCFDPQAEVRRIAARVMETYRESPIFAEACHQVRDCLTHPDPLKQRYAVAALGILRDRESIEALIERLDEADPQTQKMAVESLCSISGQQFGIRQDAWRSWFKRHRDDTREEWLAASLSHKDARVRAWAHDELVRVTGFDSEFDAQAPRSQRNAAIERWHTWFQSRFESPKTDPSPQSESTPAKEPARQQDLPFAP